MTYADKLKDPRWQKLRLEILERDEFTCQLCKDTQTELHVHHFTYPKSHNPWDSSKYSLTTYCKHCHAVVEYNKNNESYPYDIFKIPLENNKIQMFVFSTESDYVELYKYHEKDNTVSYLSSISEPTLKTLYEYLNARNKFIELRKVKTNG